MDQVSFSLFSLLCSSFHIAVSCSRIFEMSESIRTWIQTILPEFSREKNGGNLNGIITDVSPPSSKLSKALDWAVYSPPTPVKILFPVDATMQRPVTLCRRRSRSTTSPKTDNDENNKTFNTDPALEAAEK